MCDLCRGPELPAAKGLTRRQMLMMGASVAGGIALGLSSCQEGSGGPATASRPATGASSQAGATSRAGTGSGPSGSGTQGSTRATTGAETHPGSQTASQAAGTKNAGTQTKASSQTATAETQLKASDLGSEMFPDASGKAVAHAEDAPVILVPRDEWTNVRPRFNEIVLMNGIGRITVHHTAGATETDAWKPTASQLEGIREFHSSNPPTNRGWADIAYHFAVDRAGRVWQARPLVYQGAHARQHNDHNVGIVLLGDFEVQTPAAAQLIALGLFVGFLRELYGVPLGQVFTHGELVETECPGKTLQGYMDRMRAEVAGREGGKWAPASTRPIGDGNLPVMSPATSPASLPARGR